MINIIIPTMKKHVATVDSLKDCPIKYNLILSHESGLGYARNFGARQVNNGLLVFFDDDITLDKNIWGYIISTQKGQFKMLDIKGRCCSRVACIWSRDFWAINGFDERIHYSGEDVDFYLRAIANGLKYIPISSKFVTHIKDHERWRNPLMNIKIHFEQARILIKHGLRYLNFYGGAKKYFLGWIKKPRTNLTTLIGFFYYLLVGVKR